MKTYNVKYDIGQEVYILLSKKIFKTKIDKISIHHGLPYMKFNGKTIEENDGIEIKYLVMVNEVLYSSGGHYCDFDWYNQEDVFSDKNELISKIIEY